MPNKYAGTKIKKHLFLEGVNTMYHLLHMPRKRADGKHQINSWVDAELAADVEAFKNHHGLATISDAVKQLLQLGYSTYANKEDHSVIGENRRRPKTKNPTTRKK